MKLYHCTTPKKAAKYHKTGYIKQPIRGFNSKEAAVSWGWKTGRQVIYEIDAEDSKCHMLPDHHNAWGEAYWTNDEDASKVGVMKAVYTPTKPPVGLTNKEVT